MRDARLLYFCIVPIEAMSIVVRIQTAILALLTGAFFVFPQGDPSLSGKWEGERSGKHMVIEFMRNGTFSLTTIPDENEEIRGHYTRNGENIQLLRTGQFFPDVYGLRFEGSDNLRLTSSSGERIALKRRNPPAQSAQEKLSAKKNSAVKPGPIVFQRVWEPNERAFSLLVPQGWKISGGVFRVDPARMNGHANSLSPKCDLTVSRDDRGTVMIKWIPSWSYADLSRNAMGPEMIRSERPRAVDFRVIAEDPMVEISTEYAQKLEEVNSNLRKTGLDPMRISSFGAILEYREAGEAYRESTLTTIIDHRSGASTWSNQNTLMFRAPAAEFETWKAVLDIIRTSRVANSGWLDFQGKSGGASARAGWDTQFEMDAAAGSLVENRRSAKTESGAEQWLFPDPEYGYRVSWESDRGEILYTDDAQFDPNASSPYKVRRWKRTE
jgi:hypothetical protein